MFNRGDGPGATDEDQLVLVAIGRMCGTSDTPSGAVPSDISRQADLAPATVDGILARLVRRRLVAARPPSGWWWEPPSYELTDRGRIQLGA